MNQWVGHRDAAQRWPVRRERVSIAWEPIPAWRHAGLADFQTSFADTCARSTAAAALLAVCLASTSSP
jgi:hypothetical protein